MARVDNGALCARARCVMTAIALSTPPSGTVRPSAPIISARLQSTRCPRNRGRYTRFQPANVNGRSADESLTGESRRSGPKTRPSAPASRSGSDSSAGDSCRTLSSRPRQRAARSTGRTDRSTPSRNCGARCSNSTSGTTVNGFASGTGIRHRQRSARPSRHESGWRREGGINVCPGSTTGRYGPGRDAS